MPIKLNPIGICSSLIALDFLATSSKKYVDFGLLPSLSENYSNQTEPLIHTCTWPRHTYRVCILISPYLPTSNTNDSGILLIA